MNTSVRKFSVSFLNGIRNRNNLVPTANMCSFKNNYETLTISNPKPFVYHVEMNRPKQLNAMNKTMWIEFGKCFKELHSDPECRVIILSGSGRLFCAGIDLHDMIQLAPKISEHDDILRKSKILSEMVELYQHSFTSMEKCCKPVLASVHSACIGAGVDMITAADIRYCTKDAYFQVKEVDIGMAADVGTLQRLPKVIGSDSLARELCYTARKFPAEEALTAGLVSKVFNDKESMMTDVLKLAEEIASKSPVAIQATKMSLVYSRDHPVQEGLDHIARWNQFALLSEDFTQATIAQATKQPQVTFSKL